MSSGNNRTVLTSTGSTADNLPTGNAEARTRRHTTPTDAIALPILSREEVRLANAFARRFEPVQLGTGPLAFQVSALRLSREVGVQRDPTLTLALCIGTSGAELQVPLDLVEPLLEEAPELGLDDPAVPLLLEALLDAECHAAEALLAAPVGIYPEAPEPPGPLVLRVDWQRGGTRGQTPVIVRGGQGFFAALAELVAHAKPLPTADALVARCPLSSGIVLHDAGLGLQALRALRRGDVAMLDGAPLELREGRLTGRVRLRCDQFAFAATLNDSALQLHSPAVPLGTGGSMATTDAPPSGEEIGSLDDLELTVTFESDRKPETLATLKTMAPGTVFQTGVSVVDPVTIRANGRAIGRGSLVAIGDAIGVRVEQLYETAPGAGHG